MDETDPEGVAGSVTFCLMTADVVLLQAPSATGAPGIDTSASAAALAQALQVEPGTVTGGTFLEHPPGGTPTAVVSVPVAGFPHPGS